MQKSNFSSGKSYPKGQKRAANRQLEQSQNLLKSAWDGADGYGESSKSFLACLAHLNRLKAYALPTDNNARDTYREALRLAWCASWRALDFSAQALESRFPGLRRRLEQSSVYGTKKTSEGTEWILPFFPHVDATGKALPPLNQNFTLENFINLVLAHFSEDALAGMIIRQKAGAFARFDLTLAWLCVPNTFLEQLKPCHTANALFEGEYINNPNSNANQIDHEAPIFLSDVRFNGINKFSTKFNSAKFFGELSGSGIQGISANFRDCQITGKVTLESQITRSKPTIFRRVNLEKLELATGSQPIRIIDCEINDLDVSTNAHDIKISASSGKNWKLKPGIGSVGIYRSCVERLTVATSAETENFFIKKCVAGTLSVSGQITNLYSRANVFGRFAASHLKLTTAIFNEDTFCLNSRFLSSSTHNAEFSGVHFKQDLNVSSFEVSESLKFVNSVRSGLTRAVEFHGEVDFSAQRFGERGEFQKLEIDGAKFSKNVTFANRKFNKPIKINNVEFGGMLKLHGSQLNPDTTLEGTFFDKPSLSKRVKGICAKDRDALLLEYENSFRDCRLKFEEHKAHAYEAKFHRLELIAKRMQGNSKRWYLHPLSVWPERVTSIAYDTLARYGQSYLRPLAALVVVTLISAVLFETARTLPGTISTQTVEPSPPHWRITIDEEELSEEFNFDLGFEVASRNVVRPFHTFGIGFERFLAIGSSDEPNPSAQSTYRRYTDVGWFQPISFIQSGLNIVLLFLFILGIRRRFQIKE